ncbi:MAG: glycosyltransferase [Candidatus Chloroheliales bacterium]|nr:MAG: glycosyltransferase [Chloroflexota bacterium]
METNSQGHLARRFLFSTSAGYGHFHPLVPLARALQEAGHEVAFAVRPLLQSRVEAAGFTCFTVGGERDKDPEYQQFKALQQTMPVSLETELFTYPRLFCGIAPRLRTPSMVEICRSWQPDMIIREAGEYSAVIAAEYLGLPHAVVSFAAALKAMPVFERSAAEQLDPIRRSWGLAADPALTSLYRYLYLAYSPPSFGLHDVGLPGVTGSIPPTIHFIRPQFFDQADNESLPAWVTRLPAQPTVYVTLGTEVNKEPDLYPGVLQTIIAGLRDAPINLIVTLGRDKDPADFGPQPANVHIERYIPQSLLLHHCDLMVMHGGSNSLLAALDIDLPLVVVPLIADQFFNAHITQTMRLGQVVQRGQLTPTSIRAAVEEVLANPIYRQNAARLQAEMHALPDQEYAVGLVERVAAEREAVLNTGLTATL